MFDVDHFKQINDTYGHAAGDQVLKAVVGICQQVLRENDLFGRIGGEEFVVALLETDPATSMKVANRICQSIASTPVALSNGEYLTSTISIVWWCIPARIKIWKYCSVTATGPCTAPSKRAVTGLKHLTRWSRRRLFYERIEKRFS